MTLVLVTLIDENNKTHYSNWFNILPRAGEIISIPLGGKMKRFCVDEVEHVLGNIKEGLWSAPTVNLLVSEFDDEE